MYRCDNCGLLFDEPKKYIEDTGEHFSGCPSCYGDYTEIYECKWCGEYTEDERCICERCISETIKKVNRILEEEFTSEEREIIEEYIEDLTL